MSSRSCWSGKSTSSTWTRLTIYWCEMSKRSYPISSSSVRLESWIQLKIYFQLKLSLNWSFNLQLSTNGCRFTKHSRHPHLVRCPLIKFQLKVEGWRLKLQLRDSFNWKQIFNWIQLSSLTCVGKKRAQYNVVMIYRYTEWDTVIIIWSVWLLNHDMFPPSHPHPHPHVKLASVKSAEVIWVNPLTLFVHR